MATCPSSIGELRLNGAIMLSNIRGKPLAIARTANPPGTPGTATGKQGPQILDGCVDCVDLCPGDVLKMGPKTNKAVVAYFDECWYCGVCRLDCPVDVVRFEFPVRMTGL